MKKNIISSIIFTLFLISPVFSQEDEILLTIDNHNVTKSEFERIYHKNNSSTVYDNKSIEEYLELFINFKLKVIEAEALGYDTITSFIKELAGYREQLTKPYLSDKEITENLLQEAYYRTTNIVSASHILISLDQDASPEDTALAYNNIIKIRNRIISGESFDAVARETSEDRSAKRNGGYLGWFGAFRMVYSFEDVAYNTPVGEISMPFRTRFGYHILKNEGIKPAQGKVKLGYIYFMAKMEDSAQMKSQEKRAQECYERLKNGEDFSQMARIYSDEKRSIKSGGILDWMNYEVLPPEFETVVTGMDSGEFSPIISNNYGFHILKIFEKAPVDSYETLKPELEKKISNSERNQKITTAFIEKTKKENNYKEYPENIQALATLIDESVYDGNWDVALAESYIDPVCTFGDKDYLQRDLAQYIVKQKKYSKNLKITDILKNKFTEFSNEKAIEYEKSLLENKYIDFKNLMDEYHDGILLFNLTDDMVWSKAVKDTAGLKNFYELNKNKYTWGERADLSIYTTSDTNLIKKVLKVAKKRVKSGFSAKDALISICGNDSIQCVTIKDIKIEKDDLSGYKNLSWEKGTYTINPGKKNTEVIIVNSILQPQTKRLDEARGLITADYQSYLENEWIKSLRNKYKIEVNQEVLSHVK